MNKQFVKDAFGWGFLLWLVGYALGILLFAVVPTTMIGWVILPIGVLLALWILTKKVKSNSLLYYVYIAITWTAIAVIFDYFFLVKASIQQMVITS